MAYGGQSAVYCSSAKYASVAAWAATHAYSVGNLVRQLTTPVVNNERVWLCIVAGTSSGTEPTWTFARGDKITDGTVTWIEVTGLPGVNGDITHTGAWNNVTLKNQGVNQGHMIKDVAGTHLFVCTTAGTAGNGAEPTWNTAALGNTTVDNTVTWTYVGTSFSAWGAPHARTKNMLTGSWGNLGTSGTLSAQLQLFFVGNNHAESQTGTMTWPEQGSGAVAYSIDILCVNEAGSMPPVAADLTTGASVTTTTAANNQINLDSFIRMCYGLTFNMGCAGGNMTLTLNNTDACNRNWEKCNFIITGGGSSSVIRLGGGSAASLMRLRDCTFKFNNTGQSVNLGGTNRLINCTVDGTGSIPATLAIEGSAGETLWTDSDLSNLTGGTRLCNNNGTQNCRTTFADCKLPTGFLPYRANGGSGIDYQGILSRCSVGTDVTEFQLIDRAGALNTDTAIFRTGGAVENSVNFGWNMTTTATGLSDFGGGAFKAPPIAIYNSVTGANVTVTLYGLVNAAAVPSNLDAFMEVEYLGSATSMLGTNQTTRAASALSTTALTADTSAWDTGATARANSTVYTAGQIIKLASNSGRIFFCTTGGTSSGSEPAGYASAVDGGSVTDGTAVFLAACRFKITAVLSSPQPGQQGNIYVQTFVGNALSTTYYFDPLPTLT